MSLLGLFGWLFVGAAGVKSSIDESAKTTKNYKSSVEDKAYTYSGSRGQTYYTKTGQEVYRGKDFETHHDVLKTPKGEIVLDLTWDIEKRVMQNAIDLGLDFYQSYVDGQWVYIYIPAAKAYDAEMYELKEFKDSETGDKKYCMSLSLHGEQFKYLKTREEKYPDIPLTEEQYNTYKYNVPVFNPKNLTGSRLINAETGEWYYPII